MNKKGKLILVAVIIVIIVSIFPLYFSYGSGDISGSKVLQHPFLKAPILCALVGGNFKKEVRGWGDGYIRYCLVKSQLICKLRGGEIIQAVDKTIQPNQLIVQVSPAGSCRKK